MDLCHLARRRLPAPVFHFLEGGSDDEESLRRNCDSFERYALVPSYGVDVTRVDLSSAILGRAVGVPLILAPTGMSRLFHHEGELAVARAAAKFGAWYTLSTMGTCSIEEVAAVSNGPLMFQIYVHRDRGLTTEFVARCKAAGYHALCVTIDVPVLGNRERDRVTGMTIPPRFGLGSLWSFATHPAWSLRAVTGPKLQLANVAHRREAKVGTVSLIEYANSQFDRSVTWADIRWLVEQWQGPFVIKGVLSVADAMRAAEAGATAIMVSNHGGRQLDGAVAPAAMISRIRDAVGSRLQVILDGGVRRGGHIVKAVALGADACAIGRPYLYGLAAGGQAGVERALALLKAELERDLALLGCTDLRQVGRQHLDL
jgi:L-lactate dehydrogenase (cytochrome)